MRCAGLQQYFCGRYQCKFELQRSSDFVSIGAIRTDCLFQASYTFSKAIDQGASFENELNPLNFNATRGLSLLDAKIGSFSARCGSCLCRSTTGSKGKL